MHFLSLTNVHYGETNRLVAPNLFLSDQVHQEDRTKTTTTTKHQLHRARSDGSVCLARYAWLGAFDVAGLPLASRFSTKFDEKKSRVQFW